jgi:hypothetical protein
MIATWAIPAVGPADAGQHRHADGMGAGHLYRQCRLDHGKRRVEASLRNSSRRHARGVLDLRERGIDEVAGRRAQGGLQALPPELVVAVRRVGLREIAIDGL